MSDWKQVRTDIASNLTRFSWLPHLIAMRLSRDT
jgi:hypothetical protein